MKSLGDIMLYGDTMLSDKADIIGVLRRSLSKIDPRLIDHGERVAFIALSMYDELPARLRVDLPKLTVLCILHDIGAYKTNEIDDMILFDTEKPYDHSLFGYLFLKNTSHLSQFAEALLYHHTSHSELVKKSCDYAAYAEIIHIADRADILLADRGGGLEPLREGSGTRFDPDCVDALLRAEKRKGISRSIASGEYAGVVQDAVAAIPIGAAEAMDYLTLLVYAIDFRSPYTVTHTADTTIISMELGRLLGLCEHDMRQLYAGAFLHDIGKIAIPHEILEKPGRLTPAEFDIVKRHIPEGEEILRGVVSDEVADIALRHHEKLDGSGYSRGLGGASLTLPQRIVAVADIFSALSQRRSYKEPFPKEKVIGILTDMKASGLLCPLVVDAATVNYDTILSNTEMSHDPVKLLYSNLQREYAECRLKIS